MDELDDSCHSSPRRSTLIHAAGGLLTRGQRPADHARSSKALAGSGIDLDLVFPDEEMEIGNFRFELYCSRRARDRFWPLWEKTLVRWPTIWDADSMVITVRPVVESCFDDVQTVFGQRGQPARCQCQGYRMGWHALHTDAVPGRRELLRDQVIEGHGLVAHLDGEPVGWCSLAPRCDYAFLRQTVWKGRDENRDDAGIWAVTCFVTRAGFRHRGVSRALVAGTIDLARDRGARILEAYPIKPAPGKDITWGEMHVGALSAFLDAGFRVLHVPSLRRAIVRYDY